MKKGGWDGVEEEGGCFFVLFCGCFFDVEATVIVVVVAASWRDAT